MKCLVTGAAGNIGSHLCETLVAAGHEVYGVDDFSGGRIQNLASLADNKKFVLYGQTILKHVTGISDFDWVFHLAAKADIVPSIKHPMRYHWNNVSGTLGMIHALVRSKRIKKFVYAASSSCYGIPKMYPTPETAAINPMYPYALTKRLGEEIVLHWSKVYGIPAISLRLFNVYGPRFRTNGAYGAVMGVFLAQLANKAPLTIVGDGEQARDFTHVRDVCDAMILAASSDLTNIAMNVGSGDPQTVNKLADLLTEGKFDYPRISLPDRPGEPRVTHADITLIRQRLGWKPSISLEQGIKELRKRISDFKDAPLWDERKIAQQTREWFRYLGDK